ncbi:MAG: HAD family phosphatase [Candidatus Promineifilaceae bacterium]|nr:HAD family phosphatase [Candidatus Promineifilaceae bacterium]
MTIDTILFDVGGVLITSLDPQTARTQRDRMASELGFDSGDALWLHFYDSDVWRECKTGRMVHEEMWDVLLRPYGFATRTEQAAFVAEFHGDEGLDPEMEQLVARLHGQYRMGILSNWDDRLEMILAEQIGVDHYFDVIVNSHRIGAAKPEESAFEIALERLGVRPEQVFFIDDQARNTRVAAAMGMETHTFESVEKLKDDLAGRGLLTP